MNFKKLLCLVTGHMWIDETPVFLPRRKCESCGEEQVMLVGDYWMKAKKRCRND